MLKNIINKIFRSKEQTNSEMYYSFYLFGLSNSKPIWNWENWEKCIPVLQPIIDLSPEIPFIKTEQSIPVKYGKNNENSSYNKGVLSFGPMIWSDKNNEKWTTKYCNEENWTFFNTEIAYPTRSFIHKNRGAKSSLLIIVSNSNLSENKDAIIDQAITIHISSHLLDEKKLILVENKILRLAEILNTKIAGKIKRPSSFKSDISIGYTDSIWDGAYGVLNIENSDFSDNYKRYSIKKINGSW